MPRLPHINLNGKHHKAAVPLGEKKAVSMWTVRNLGVDLQPIEIRRLWEMWIGGSRKIAPVIANFFRRQYTSALGEIVVAQYLGDPRWSAYDRDLELGIKVADLTQDCIRKARICTTEKIGSETYQVTKSMASKRTGLDFFVFCERSADKVWIIGWVRSQDIAGISTEEMFGKRAVFIVPSSKLRAPEELRDLLGTKGFQSPAPPPKPVQTSLFGEAPSSTRHQDPA